MKIWSHNFYWICETNLWLYASAYAFLIHLPQSPGAGTGGLLWATFLGFIAGMWGPGVFTAHLMERVRRKHIYLYALAGCLLCTLLIPHADKAIFLPAGQGLDLSQSYVPLIALRTAQGACYGLALNTGSTLSVDVTPSPKRDEANTLFTRLGRTGIGLGILAACLSALYFGHSGIYYFSLAAGVLAFFSACLLHVPFHAPILLPLCSTDRFLLPRVWPEMLNVFFVAMTSGALLFPILEEMSRPTGLATYMRPAIAALGGFAWALSVLHHYRATPTSHLLPFAGLCMLALGCGMEIMFHNGATSFLIKIFLLTAGTELAATRLLKQFIHMAKHSQRCTAVNSYLLAWESGFFGGVATGIGWGKEIDKIPLYCALIALLLFTFFTFRHYKRHKIY